MYTDDYAGIRGVLYLNGIKGACGGIIFYSINRQASYDFDRTSEFLYYQLINNYDRYC